MEETLGKYWNLKITCAICYISFDNKRKIITLDCGHFFCNFCLMRLNEDTASESGFKCSICRAMNKSFNYLNEDVVRRFNDYVSRGVIEKGNKQEDTIISKESFNFCKDCNIIIDNEELDSHKSYKKAHEMLSGNEFRKLIEDIFNLDELLFNTNSVEELASKVFSNFANIYEGNIPREILINYLMSYLANQAKAIIKNSINSSEYEERLTLKRIHNFKKQLKLLKNPVISKNLLETVIKHKEDPKRFIPCFIENTKKLAIFDLSFLDINTYEIKDLSINFTKTDSIEYDQITEKFFFISRALGNHTFSSGASTVWVYSIKKDELKSVFTLDYPVIDHRSVIIMDKLFIIGGRTFSNKNKHYKYLDTICSIHKHSYKFSKNIHLLSYPRANFGLNYANNQLYICFGLTDDGKYLNNIEIITMFDNSFTKFISRVVNLDLHIDINLCLKNIGVLVHSHKLIILGGEGNNSKCNSIIYTFDLSDSFKLVDSFQSKEIVSGSFTNYGISFNSLYGFISNHTDVSEIPHVYLYSELNRKWSCHGIDIY